MVADSPPAAIADDGLVLGEALGREFGRRIAERCEGLVGRDRACRRNVDAAGDATRPAIAAGLQALVKLRPERVEDPRRRAAEGGRDGVAVAEVARPWCGGKGSGRIALCRARLDGAPLGFPFVEAAIQNGRMVKSE